jgi:anti-sigma regulatory factor (Ser/Thr protein kinase)
MTDLRGTEMRATGWRSSLRMPYSTRSVRDLRHRLVRELQAHDLPVEVVDDLSFVLGELATNAIEHGEPLAHGGLGICWGAWDGAVHVEVTDGASTLPLAGVAPIAATGGRGLAIVAALSTSWGVRPEAEAKTVWAALAVHHPAA